MLRWSPAWNICDGRFTESLMEFQFPPTARSTVSSSRTMKIFRARRKSTSILPRKRPLPSYVASLDNAGSIRAWVRNTDLQSVRRAELHSAEPATMRASAGPETADSMSAGRTGQRPVFRLLIGDQAIRFRAEHGERYHYWDLAETWTKMTSLPFAFAFWLIRPEIENAKEIADKLRALRDHNVASIDELALSQSEVSPTFCRKYYREHLFFDFGEREKAGLREFHRRCLLNKIDVAPDLRLNLV